jgi:hypothetical protein
MANPFDQFDEPAASSGGNPFDQFDEGRVKPGDVEARKKQVAAQAAAEQPNVARERLGSGGILNPVTGAISEAFGGAKDFGSGIIDTLSGAVNLSPTEAGKGLLKTGLGAVRTVASPLAGLTDIASDAGEATHKFLTNLGLEGGADIGAGLVQSALDVVGPMGIGRLGGALRPAVSGLKSKRMVAADKAAELAKSEADTAGRVAAIKSGGEAAQESVESIAQAEKSMIPSVNEIRERFAKDAPLGMDVGADFKGTYRSKLGQEKSKFNKLYDEALSGTDDIEVPASSYLERIEKVLAEKGVSRPLATQAEKVASKAKGALDVTEEAADQLAALERDIGRAADPASKKMLQDSMQEFIEEGRLPAQPTVRDLVMERQRLKAGQRIAVQAKNDNLTRQFNELIDGITEDIPKGVRNNLAAVDKQYLDEFVPFFGKKSVTRAIAEGNPENVLDLIIRPAGSSKSVEKATRAWELMDDAGRESARKAFVNQGLETAMSDGAFKASNFTKWWDKYSDRSGTGDKVLKTVFGDSYNDMRSVITQLQTSKPKSIDQVAADLTKGFQQAGAAQTKSAEAAQKLMKQRLEKEINELMPERSGARVSQRLESIGSGIIAGGTVASLIGHGAWGRIVAGGILILTAKGVGGLLASAKGRNIFKAMARSTPGTSQAAATARQAQNLLQNLEEE